MSRQLRSVWETVVPPRDGRDGPLPGLLVLLTVVTGLVDAFSYLELRRVFVANMTSNVVFSAFAAGGAPGFLWWASLLAIFTLVLARSSVAGSRHLLLPSAIQAVLVRASGVVA